jgi:haloalkane dehalogenase
MVTMTARLLDAAPTTRPHAPQTTITPASTSWAAEYPFTSRFVEVERHPDETGAAGHHPSAPRPVLHYLDEGPRGAPVLVFFHGNPTWSFYWRNLIKGLRDRYRCIAIDHLGMGLSDRPQLDRFLLEGHVDRAVAVLAAVLGAEGVDRFSVIGHDWGGCIAAGVAGRLPEQVESIVWMNTAAFLSKDIPFSIAICRIPVFGALAVRGFNAFAGVATWRAMAKHERMTPTVKAGLLAPYGNWHDRIATLRFVEDIPLDRSHPSYGELARIEKNLTLLKNKPVALFWGDDDFCFTPAFRQRFEKEFPSAEVHAWADCGHYVVEDAPERVLPLLARFFDRLGDASRLPAPSSPASPSPSPGASGSGASA